MYIACVCMLHVCCVLYAYTCMSVCACCMCARVICACVLCMHVLYVCVCVLQGMAAGKRFSGLRSLFLVDEFFMCSEIMLFVDRIF